jgi:hypothetical protein
MMTVCAPARKIEATPAGVAQWTKIAGPDLVHLLLADLAVVQWRAPIGCTLKHGQVTNGLGHFLDGLHSGRTGYR